MSLDAEEQAFQAEVEAVKNWWKDDRWRQTTRPYTAEAIVSKRGNLPIQYPSNAQSKKLWKILESRFANKEVSATYGCLDPVMVTQMAKYLDTVYVSGWQCSSTASSSHEPSPDLADYPMVSFFSLFVRGADMAVEKSDDRPFPVSSPVNSGGGRGYHSLSYDAVGSRPGCTCQFTKLFLLIYRHLGYRAQQSRASLQGTAFP
jgi:hypothetical protein